MRATITSDLDEINFRLGRNLSLRKVLSEHLSTSSNAYTYFNSYTYLSLYFVCNGQVEFFVDENKGSTCHEGDFIIVNNGSQVKYEVRDVHESEVVIFCFLEYETDLNVVRNGLPQSAAFSFLGTAIQETFSLLARNESMLRHHYIACDEKLNEALNKHLKDEQLLAQRLIAQNGNTRIEIFNKVCKAREFILKNLMNSVSLESIASEIGMSKYHFSRCFSAVYLVSPHKYLLEMKLQLALRLITSEEMPLSDIPFYLQFTDLAYFSNQFKQRFGIRPSVLIRNQISNRQHLPVGANVN